MVEQRSGNGSHSQECASVFNFKSIRAANYKKTALTKHILNPAEYWIDDDRRGYYIYSIMYVLNKQ